MEINKMQKLCKAKFAAGYEEERDTNEAQAVLFVVWFFLIAGVKGVEGGFREVGGVAVYILVVSSDLWQSPELQLHWTVTDSFGFRLGHSVLPLCA